MAEDTTGGQRPPWCPRSYSQEHITTTLAITPAMAIPATRTVTIPFHSHYGSSNKATIAGNSKAMTIAIAMPVTITIIAAVTVTVTITMTMTMPAAVTVPTTMTAAVTVPITLTATISLTPVLTIRLTKD